MALRGAREPSAVCAECRASSPNAAVSSATRSGKDLRLRAALAVTILLWASAFPGIRAGLEGYGPGELALLRYLVASATLGAYALFSRMRFPPLAHWGAFLAIGATGFTIYNLALNFGERTVMAGPAAFLVATVPLFTALLAVLTLRERLSRHLVLGLATGLVGAGVIALAEEGGLGVDLGALLVLGAAVSQAVYFVLQKRWLATYRPLELTTYAIWAGTLLMVPFLPRLVDQAREAPAGATLAVLYLGVLPGAVAYVAWAYVLSRMPASLAAPYLYLAPVAAYFIAWVWLGETPRALALVGGALALGGVAIAQRPWATGSSRTATPPLAHLDPDGTSPGPATAPSPSHPE